MTTSVYHVLKSTEGGLGQAEAIRIAKDKGAKKVERSTSCYVGHTAMVVTASERVHESIRRGLWG